MRRRSVSSARRTCACWDFRQGVGVCERPDLRQPDFMLLRQQVCGRGQTGTHLLQRLAQHVVPGDGANLVVGSPVEIPRACSEAVRRYATISENAAETWPISSRPRAGSSTSTSPRAS